MAGKSKKASNDALEELHNAIATGLSDLIKDGKADAAHFGAAIRFLKDNNITAVVKPGTPTGDLLDEIDPEHIGDEEFERVKAEFAKKGATAGNA